MKYAILSISGSQYFVKEGDVLTIDNQNQKEGEKISNPDVLFYTDDQEVKIGTPTLPDYKVEYEILKNYKGKKLRVSNYKAKSRYRLVKGFRSSLTDIKILSLGSPQATPKAKKAPAKKKTPVPKKAVKTVKKENKK
jgi:large subunit ribosomal protein L21